MRFKRCLEVETQDEPQEDQDLEVEIIEEETKDDGSSLNEEEKPFNERPEFQNRIKEIEDKYGQKAKTLDALMDSARNDPEYYLKTVKLLEEAGQFPAGTYKLAEKQVKDSQKEAKKAEVEHEREIDNEILDRPEIQYARRLYEQERKKQEDFLESYEQRHPQIAQSADPVKARGMIGTVAEGLMATKGLSREDAMERAFQVLFASDEVVEDATKQAELTARYNAQQNTVVNTSVTRSGAPKKTIRMTAEQKAAADSIGMSYKEYMKYVSEDSGMVD